MGLNVEPSADAPDIDSVASADWTRRSFPIHYTGQPNLVQIVVKRSVLQAICAHGLSRTDVEVCGVLVGECCQDDRGPFIYVEAMVRGEHSENQVAQVTFTSETWSHIHAEMDRDFPAKKILGWYHTHPGFGIFLSAMDLFIHENFFNASDQLALVYDPISGESGLFVWRQGKALVGPYLIEEDVSPEKMPEVKSPLPNLTAAGRSDVTGFTERLQRLERRQTTLLTALIALALLAIAWPVAVARLGIPWAFQSRPEQLPGAESSPSIPQVRLPELPAQPPRSKQPSGRSVELPDFHQLELKPRKKSGRVSETYTTPELPQQDPAKAQKDPEAGDGERKTKPAPAPSNSNSPTEQKIEE